MICIFSSNPNTPTVGFCVMGGIFSEGIDLQNEAVIGNVKILGLKNVIINLGGNIVMFMPLGYFLPRIAKYKKGMWFFVPIWMVSGFTS